MRSWGGGGEINKVMERERERERLLTPVEGRLVSSLQ